MNDEKLAQIMYGDWIKASGELKSEPSWENLTESQQKRWIYVAEMVREPVMNDLKTFLTDEIYALEDINNRLRDILWVILQQCADHIGFNIEVDRY